VCGKNKLDRLWLFLEQLRLSSDEFIRDLVTGTSGQTLRVMLIRIHEFLFLAISAHKTAAVPNLQQPYNYFSHILPLALIAHGGPRVCAEKPVNK